MNKQSNDTINTLENDLRALQETHIIQGSFLQGHFLESMLPWLSILTEASASLQNPIGLLACCDHLSADYFDSCQKVLDFYGYSKEVERFVSLAMSLDPQLIGFRCESSRYSSKQRFSLYVWPKKEIEIEDVICIAQSEFGVKRQRQLILADVAKSCKIRTAPYFGWSLTTGGEVEFKCYLEVEIYNYDLPLSREIIKICGLTIQPELLNSFEHTHEFLRSRTDHILAINLAFGVHSLRFKLNYRKPHWDDILEIYASSIFRYDLSKLTAFVQNFKAAFGVATPGFVGITPADYPCFSPKIYMERYYETRDNAKHKVRALTKKLLSL